VGLARAVPSARGVSGPLEYAREVATDPASPEAWATMTVLEINIVIS
jgi:hypothetical protein